MKKLFFVVVFALVGFSCFAQSHIEGWHSDYSSCTLYAGKKYSLWDYQVNTREAASSFVNKFLDFCNYKNLNVKSAKPFKNEIETAFDAISEHYEPEEGEMYHLVTTTKNSPNTVQRHIYIWFDKDDYYYWVYEQVAG